MSSGFLNSNDMNMLQRLLEEVPARGGIDDANNAITLARMLVGAVERGVISEPSLRVMISAYRSSVGERALERWDNEGGAAERAAP